MKRLENEFPIIIVYVDDINVIETPKVLPKAILLKERVQNERFGKDNFVFDYKLNI